MHARPYMRFAATLLAALAVAAAPAAAVAADNPEPLLAGLAAHQTHGWATIQHGIDYPAMEATINAGGRVYVPCGVIAMLAKRLLDRHGIPNRLIGTFSDTQGDLYDVPPGTLESHAMIEVWESGRWVLYDMDGNVKAVDETGAGVGIVQFASGPRHYERLTDPANDPDYDLAASPNPMYESWLFANHESWYDRVLGTLTVRPACARAYYFNDPALKDALDPTASYQWVPDDQWATILHAPPASQPTLPAPPKPVPAPVAVAPKTVPAVTHPLVSKKPNCRRERRRYRRTHSRAAHRRYRRCQAHVRRPARAA